MKIYSSLLILLEFSVPYTIMENLIEKNDAGYLLLKSQCQAFGARGSCFLLDTLWKDTA